jgi:transposase
VIRPAGDVQIHLYRHPVDMRKAINGLVAMVEGELELDPFSADLFVFCNRTRNLVKMIAWEGNGFVLWMKRLEKSRFKWPLSMPIDVVQLNAQEINWLLDGYPLTIQQGHQQLAHHTVL